MLIKHFKTFAVLDIETNTLPECGRQIWITELSIAAFSKKDFIESSLTQEKGIPRILNKMHIVLRPLGAIDSYAENITGLNNYILEDESPFNENTCDMINSFLEHLQQPVCLVAFNGNAFDFKILKEHFRRKKKRLPENLLTVDSWEAFKIIDRENGLQGWMSYSLKAVCIRVLGEEPVNYHQADGDVESLLKCMLRYGQQFLDYCEIRAVGI